MMRAHRHATLLAAALCVAALPACSGGGGGYSSSSSSASASAATGPARITIKNFEFKPLDLTVKSGAKVTVSNEDTTTHTVTAKDNKSFDTGDIADGSTTTFTAPTKAGTYDYLCTIHTFMKGKLTVR